MAGLDRLNELQKLSGYSKKSEPLLRDPSSSSTSEDSTTFLQPYDTIKQQFDIIQQTTMEIHKLQIENKTIANDKERRVLMSRLQKITDDSDKLLKQIKSALDQIQKQNEKSEHKGSASEIRQNLLQTHLRKFAIITSEYNQAKQNFRDHLQKREKKLLTMVCPQLTSEEVDHVVESGQAQEVMKHAIISDDLLETVKCIEERHLDIMRLEQSILEIASLFRDLSTLVDLQQDSLDVIQIHIDKAERHAEEGHVKLQSAERYQTKARNRRCCLLLILVGCLVFIVTPVILGALRIFG